MSRQAETLAFLGYHNLNIVMGLNSTHNCQAYGWLMTIVHDASDEISRGPLTHLALVSDICDKRHIYIAIYVYVYICVYNMHPVYIYNIYILVDHYRTRITEWLCKLMWCCRVDDYVMWFWDYFYAPKYWRYITRLSFFTLTSANKYNG